MKRILLIVIFVFLSAPAIAATFYISQGSGDDSYTSVQAQSSSTPWKCHPWMAGATGNSDSYTVQAGDTFYFKKGDTWGSAELPLTVPTGAPNNVTLTVTDWGTGTYAIFDAESTDSTCITGPYSSGTGLNMTFSYLKMQGATGSWCFDWQLKNDFTVENCYFDNCGFASDRDVIFQNNYVNFNSHATGQNNGVAVYIWDGYLGSDVIGNEILGSCYAGIKVKESGNLVEFNYIHDVDCDNGSNNQLGILFRDTSSSIIRYNIIDMHLSPEQSTLMAGMSAWNAGGSNKIYNNTIVGNGYGYGVQSTELTGDNYRNNIVFDFGTAFRGENGNAQFNDIYSCSTQCDGFTCSNNITSDPKFADETFDGVDDFQIQSDSPMINAGTPYDDYSDTDYWGNDIVGNPDIGAHEYTAGETPASPAITGVSLTGVIKN